MRPFATAMLLLLCGCAATAVAGTVTPELRADGPRHEVRAVFTAGRDPIRLEGRALAVGVDEIYLASADVVGLLRLGRYWDPDRRQLTLRSHGLVCEATAGSRLLRIDGRDHLLVLPPAAFEGDLWLPMDGLVRLLAPALAEPVDWDPESRTLRFGGARRNVLDARIDAGVRSTTLRLRCSEPLSFRAARSGPDRIVLKIYGGVADVSALERTRTSGLVGGLAVRQSADLAEVEIRHGPLAADFHAHAEDGGRLLVLTLEESPVGALPDPSIRGGHGAAVSGEAARTVVDRVVIDPGHGGLDAGRIGAGGRHEKDVVLRLARDLGEALRARGFEVRLTRDGDDDRDADARAALANGFGADLLLSLHADGWFDDRVRGTTLYVQRAGGGSIADPLAFVPWEAVQQRHAGAANEFALDLEQRLERAKLLPVRGVVPGDFPLLRSLDMPAVLIETGFLTHAGDAEFLDDAGDRRRLAETIAEAVAALRDRVEAKEEVR